MTDETNKDNVVWESGIDGGQFQATVTGTAPYRGRLVVTVTETDEVLLDEEVGLAYNALFGPDIEDLADWQEKALKVVDQWAAAHE